VRVDLFDYELPAELIAQIPTAERDESRLMVLDRARGGVEHARFSDLPRWLRAGDSLVLNDTRVLYARLLGRRRDTGGRWEGLFVEEREGLWELMTKTGGKPAPGEWILLDRGSAIQLVRRTDAGTWLVKPPSSEPAAEQLADIGYLPLPPYIREGVEQPGDRERYQTIYAKEPGSVAAPTAGLHFSQRLLDEIKRQGIGVEYVTLHVGRGTFQPVQVDDTQEHVMHGEWCQLTDGTAQRLCETRQRGGRIVAVGTTAVRTLESAFAHSGSLSRFSGMTRLFITPPYQFQAVDVMATNFHLPRSTLLMLVSAFAGRERILEAYHEAVRQRYRFFSYGDAMLIV
jgi:S-adenosylmethionine:tRNA ribosyltransferase-isomerase